MICNVVQRHEARTSGGKAVTDVEVIREKES